MAAVKYDRKVNGAGSTQLPSCPAHLDLAVLWLIIIISDAQQLLPHGILGAIVQFHSDGTRLP